MSFQATRSLSLVANAGVLPFDSVSVSHYTFNQQSNTFTAPVTGYYWLYMTAGVMANNQSQIQMMGTGRNIGIERTTTNYDGVITTSTDVLVYLTSGANVSLVTPAPAYPIYSDLLLQTTFGGFLLDTIISPVIAFSFGLRSDLLSSGQKIPFDVISVDTHHGWDSGTSEYIVPVAGAYVVTLRAGSTSSAETVETYLYINSVTTMSHVYTADTSHVGPDTYTGLSLVNVNADDKIAEFLITGTLSTSTIFSGFFYSPFLSPAVAFSVGVSIGGPSMNPPVDPVPYDRVLVALGNGWNPATYRFTAPVGGVYYTHIAIMTAAILKCQMDLLKNGDAVMNNAYMSTQQSNTDSRSRGFMLRLQTGDELRVRLTAGQYYGNGILNIHFAGFLIHT